MSELKSIEQKSYELHSSAWSDQLKWGDYLASALKLLMAHPEILGVSDVAKNNFAAILLDMQRNTEALYFLKEYLPSLSESHSNMAIAIAKTNVSDIESIRSYNKSSADFPQSDYAITAYIDWQAL